MINQAQTQHVKAIPNSSIQEDLYLGECRQLLKQDNTLKAVEYINLPDQSLLKIKCYMGNNNSVRVVVSHFKPH